MTSLTFQIQANPRPHITLARLPEWCVHQHHAPTSEETQILHGKKLQCFHTALCDVMKPLGPLKNPCGCFQGNYDQYVKTREELEENQMKRFNWEQDQIAHMKVKKTQMTMCYDDHVLWMCSLLILYCSVLLELHRQVRSRLCKAGSTGTEQRENSAEDGGVRFD